MDIKTKKSLDEVHKVGDIVFVKKENKNWKIKQYPKVNGGIIVLDPFNGDVLALVGSFNFRKVSSIELHKLSGNLALLLNQ